MGVSKGHCCAVATMDKTMRKTMHIWICQGTGLRGKACSSQRNNSLRYT